MEDASKAPTDDVLRIIFAADMTERSVLDAACHLGAVCFELERRGVRRVAGADCNKETIENCRLLAREHGSQVKFILADIERDPFETPYDYVLFLDRLKRIRNPIAAIEKLIGSAREILIIELTWWQPGSGLRHLLRKTIQQILWRFPVLYLGGLGKDDWDRVNYFFITGWALAALVTRHRYSVAKVDVIAHGQSGRTYAIAHKRQIGHLLIVAGVPASGKSTLISNILAGKAAELAQELKVDWTQPWKSTGYGDVPRVTEPIIGHMVLHFNITTPIIDRDYYGYEGGLLDLIKAAKHTSVVTLWCPPRELADRYRKYRIKSNLFNRKRVRQNKKRATLLALYNETQRMTKLYAEWFEFVHRTCSEVIVYESSEAGRIMTVAEWRRENVQGNR